MSISSVGTSSSIVSAAFRQLRSTEGGGPASQAQRAGDRRAESEDSSSTDTAVIQALKKQLAEAQAQLLRLQESKAGKEAIEAAQRRVQACGLALAAAVTKQAEEAKKAERAAGGGQYI